MIGENSLANLEQAMAVEYDCHNSLSATECPHILDIYGCSLRPRLHPPHLGYLYIEYAEHGDLWDLLDHLKKNPGEQLPEPYIWLIFRGMLEAVFAMTCGTAIPKNLPSDQSGLGLEDRFGPGWEPFINPDIKPENIVLARPQDGYYSGYLTAKMIDFRVTYTERRFESSQVKGGGIGTRGWGPPEHRIPPDIWNTEYSDTPIHVHSEIFNVAQIVFSLMEGQIRPVTDKERREQRISHDPAYQNCYKDWEKAYGSVNKLEGEIPEFAKSKFNHNKTMLPIGEVAPA
ncbi:S-TKc multi-domain protein [Pyrenophora tritici-repentis]|nr:S-TKc multi-domain protein [Pyrenophora tritici-repentis]KAF7443307.1 S-TKc multi-domain protein [Pyrenophora tritici-repentis]KAF7568204.1 S-TKc multi-domain protein [Pyrenophora tritici-repentis]KAG9377003.1 S-TKc multi-domain protein [Pyrenophora tritici-repentis]KAI0569872.1 S-TKc multi-domain protein [Pyrenophora tritici-repentis]